ncbi:hypothetical protein LCGC14_0477340 [marine sediment metagenome]|uniref:Uncharacterized protein n=1 Tax=marine sediment metagenome TaxID=412755 RepID=A0A0F9VJ04_9ZZZZ
MDKGINPCRFCSYDIHKDCDTNNCTCECSSQERLKHAREHSEQRKLK